VPDAAVALVGLGVETLSMAAAAIPAVRARLADLTRAQAGEQARSRVARASLLACEEAPGQG
jgi:phosphoenolpyruvate-protein kinase (PTS system EI component)